MLYVLRNHRTSICLRQSSGLFVCCWIPSNWFSRIPKNIPMFFHLAATSVSSLIVSERSSSSVAVDKRTFSHGCTFIYITQSVANLPRGVKSISDQPSSAMVLLCVHSVTSRLSSPQKSKKTLHILLLFVPPPDYYVYYVTCYSKHILLVKRNNIHKQSTHCIHYSRVVDCSLSQWRRKIPEIGLIKSCMRKHHCCRSWSAQAWKLLGNVHMCPSQCPSQCPICAQNVYKLGHSLYTEATAWPPVVH